MADVEISYNNSTIASLDASGAEVLETNEKFLIDDITINYTKILGSVSIPFTTIDVTPIISVNSATGVISVNATKSSQITPAVTTGYISYGIPGFVNISGINTSQLTVKAATTYTPSTTTQTINAGQYLTGVQTIKGDINLTAANIAAGVSIFGVVGTHQGGGTYQSKTVSATESVQTVIPDDGYDALSSVMVNAISSTYIGSGVTQRSSSDLSVSGAVVTVPSGYYGADASMSFIIYDGSVT